MLSIYRFLINIIYLFAPLILYLRVKKNKEHKIRFKEKLGYIEKKRNKGKLIWFHASSVGETLSIIPILEKIEKIQNIKTILVTTNTLSSSKVLLNKNLKKVIHQFLPIDTNHISNNFLNYWNPALAIFVESEIWPNFIFNIKKKSIPLILLNGRITKKTFTNWIRFPTFAKTIFKKFDLCFVQNQESKKFLTLLGKKNIKDFGNLKYSQSKLSKKSNLRTPLIKNFKNKKIWCVSNTHEGEEEICIKIHLLLKEKIKNLIMIIIPRHIDRTNEIIEKIKKYNLQLQLRSKKIINKKADIFLVDTFGETNIFYNIAPIIFMGKSLEHHYTKSGQNPIEPARLGCKILHGPNVENFKDVYKFLQSLKITKQIKDKDELYSYLLQNINLKMNKSHNQRKIENKGQKILNKTFGELKKILNKNDN